MRLELGRPVNCTDGPLGKLADVVIDPTKRSVTHLVVEPDGDHGKARLVPIELASDQDGEAAIAVRCSVEEANQLEPVEETAYIRLGDSPELEAGWDLGVESVLAEPYYVYGYAGGPGYETGPPPDYDPHVTVTYDRIPKGDVEIRRASEVSSADGHHLGKVDGFLVDDDDAITHFVLERGHLWGRREVTIPINAVDSVFTDAVTLTLTKDEVGELPSVHVHRWKG